MNDRFKFRFYDNDKKIMIDEDTDYKMLLSEYGKDEWYCCFEAKFPTILDYFDYDEDYNEYDKKDFVIMQCTGLKDKNGKLIYEGDILDLYISTKKLYRYQVKYEIGSFMLVSNEEIFDFRNKWNDNVYPLSQLYFEYDNEDNCIWHCEVIGNIYENQELLEDTECQK